MELGWSSIDVWSIQTQLSGEPRIPRQSRKERSEIGFLSGMALGIVAGAAFGIGIMCCVVAGKQEDQQMEQMRIRRQKKGELKTNPFPGSGRNREVLPFGWGKPLHDGRGRNERDWALPLCGWEAGGCEWADLGDRGIPLADGTQGDSGVSLRDSIKEER